MTAGSISCTETMPPSSTPLMTIATRLASRQLAKSLVSVTSALLLSACGAAVDTADMRSAYGERPVNLTEQPVFVATTRSSTRGSDLYFNSKRGGSLRYGLFNVAIPPGHRAGEVETSASAPDLRSNFAITSGLPFDTSRAMVQGLRSAFRGTGPRRVLVFVHGFNTPFGPALFRAAQIAHDTGFRGQTVLFSWPSEGAVTGYLYDKDSAIVSRDALEQTINDIAQSGADEIILMGHSMGGWLTMEMLRQAHIADRTNFHGKLKGVILASPDISLDVFKTQMQRIGRPPYSVGILISQDDEALWASSLISGGTRVGNDPDDSALAALGVVVIDVSEVKTGDGLGHTKFAASAELLRLLGDRLNNGPPVRQALSFLKVQDRDNVAGATIKVLTPKFDPDFSQQRAVP